MLEKIPDRVYCPLLKKEVDSGYCWDLCNIGTDDILYKEDRGKVTDWKKAYEICKECEIYFEMSGRG